MTEEDAAGGAGVPGLTRTRVTAEALGRLRTILAELAALLHVLRHAPANHFTVVHDYESVAKWIQGDWKARDPMLAVVEACRRLIQERGLAVDLHHQPGHQSTLGWTR
jgi:hypothetical protein